MADDDPILADLGLKAPGTNRHWSFQVSDIVLTAAMLAGGADPIPQADGRVPQVHGSLIGKSQWHDEMTNIRKMTTRTADKSSSTTPNDF